jgi:hypothetical protein
MMTRDKSLAQHVVNKRLKMKIDGLLEILSAGVKDVILLKDMHAEVFWERIIKSLQEFTEHMDLREDETDNRLENASEE